MKQTKSDFFPSVLSVSSVVNALRSFFAALHAAGKWGRRLTTDSADGTDEANGKGFFPIRAIRVIRGQFSPFFLRRVSCFFGAGRRFTTDSADGTDEGDGKGFFSHPCYPCHPWSALFPVPSNHSLPC